jgi:hypothetical protein
MVLPRTMVVAAGVVLVVASPTNRTNLPVPTVALHYALDANFVSRLTIVPRLVGTYIRRILQLSSAMLLFLLPPAATTTGTPTPGLLTTSPEILTS